MLSEPLTLLEAARLFGCGLTTFKALVQVGAIPHMHVGRRVLLRAEDVVTYRDSLIEKHMHSHQPRVLSDLRNRSSRQKASGYQGLSIQGTGGNAQ